MEAFITKTTCSLSWGNIKKFKICSSRNNKMQCLCSNAPLHIKPKQNFYCASFFLDTFNTCKTSLISLESFFYWVIKLNAFNFHSTATIQIYKLLIKPEIITRRMCCLSKLWNKLQAYCKTKPYLCNPPPFNWFIIINLLSPMVIFQLCFCAVTI